MKTQDTIEFIEFGTCMELTTSIKLKYIRKKMHQSSNSY